MRFLKTNNKNWKLLCKGEVQAKQLEIDFKDVDITMKFEVGQKIKIERAEEVGKKRLKSNKIGEIVDVTKRIIVLQYENYKESLSVADFQKYKIYIRNNNNWVRLKIK
ncbi:MULTISPECIES: hypothetical protein [unclassified Clostridium]|uniref:hypothetical protein n=1 Tax=unclassified Clostridium TaxID=2614128 RepID=UPI000297B06A|nr:MULTISPECIES: hypothetical protein [unclassified Clostridium]EKQ56289.1 MAG: hypothetical protein A370_02045 [Clostridium sp. Maddingley MBC34-26]